MLDYLQLYLLLNLMLVVALGAYKTPGSVAHNDKLNSLLGTLLIAFAGWLVIIVVEKKKAK